MAGFANKGLWIVYLDTQEDENRLFHNAQLMGAGAVAIRSDSSRLTTCMARFKAANFKVYSWRWPAVVQNQGGRFATDEANYVAQTLIPAGLDGYIVDPESEQDGASNDWNRIDVPVAQLATTFGQIIQKAAQAAGRADFVFGITSGQDYPASRPHIPWKEFVAVSDALFPQVYWRARDNNDVCQLVKDGKPDSAFDRALPCWRAIANGKPIIPMAGELGCVRDRQELTAFAQRAKKEVLTKMHFYADEPQLYPFIKTL
jgi:hypothetical protein